jgi:putative transposase
MRYPASEKAEIIELVEQSHLPAKRTLDKLGVSRSTFYRWYDRYCEGGPEALADHRSRPDRVWNRIPDDVRRQIIDLALELPELSPRELAVRFTDERKYFVSEASVYRLLKAHDLITSPAYVVIKAANEFKDKTTAINQLWQTDFTYLKITGWGWYYLSTVLDDFSRYIVAWRLGPTMCASDVTATLDQALAASGIDHITVAHRPRLLNDNGAFLCCRRSGRLAQSQGHAARAGRTVSPANPGQDRALAPDPKEPHSARKLLSTRRSRTTDRRLRLALQSSSRS